MKVDRQLADLEVTLATEFVAIKTSFKKVDARFDTLEAKLDKTVKDGFADIASRIDTLARRRIRRGPRQ